MALVIRKTSSSVADLAKAVNDLKAYVVSLHRTVKADLLLAEPGNAFTSTTVVVGSHNDRSERTVTAPNATDLDTSLVLVNQIRGIYEFHRTDILAHGIADTANAIAAPVAGSLATAITLANELKADFNLHRVQASVHVVNDTTNVIAAANATDQSSLNTLLNELKADLNLHMASGPAAKSVRAVLA